MTIIPAKSIDLDNKIGKLDKGYLANFLITSGQIFDDKTEINENWVKGQRHVVKNTDNINIDGEYTLKVNGKSYEIKISNSLLRPSSKVKRDSTDICSISSTLLGLLSKFSPVKKSSQPIIKNMNKQSIETYIYIRIILPP